MLVAVVGLVAGCQRSSEPPAEPASASSAPSASSEVRPAALLEVLTANEWRLVERQGPVAARGHVGDRCRPVGPLGRGERHAHRAPGPVAEDQRLEARSGADMRPAPLVGATP